MRLIGLCGYSRVGKDTAARLIGGTVLSFAQPLKADLRPVIRDRYGLDPDNLTPAQKEIIRPLFVAHGAVGRAVNPRMWVDPIVGRIDGLRELMSRGSLPSQPLLVADCRYYNELDALYWKGGTIIYIDRPGFGPANDEEARSIYEILKEARDNRWTRFYTVRNDDTLEVFAGRLRSVLAEGEK